MASVLVVDDEPAMLRETRLWLMKKGHTVTTAATLDEALRNAKSSSYDLVITDKNLGGHRGITPFLDYLREEKPDTPVLMMSAEDGIRARRELYCTAFYNKFEGFDGLIKLVERLVA